MMSRDLAARKEPDQRYVAERLPHDREFGRWRAEVAAPASGATHVDGTGHATRRMRRALSAVALQGEGGFQRQPLRLQFLADLGADAHEVAPGGGGVAAAKPELRTDGHDIPDGNAPSRLVQHTEVLPTPVSAQLPSAHYSVA